MVMSATELLIHADEVAFVEEAERHVSGGGTLPYVRHRRWLGADTRLICDRLGTCRGEE